MAGISVVRFFILAGVLSGCARLDPPARTAPMRSDVGMPVESLRVNDRIRVMVASEARWTGGMLNGSDRWTEAAFDARSGDTLMFRPRAFGAEQVRIATAGVNRMEIGRPGRSHPWRGLLLGMLGGFAADAVASASCGSCLYIVPVFTITGGIVGLIAGSPHGTSWRPVLLRAEQP